MTKQPEAPLGAHLVRAAQQLSRLMAQAVLSPAPALDAKRFLLDARKVAEAIFEMPEHTPALRQRAVEEAVDRWRALAATGLEQMRTQRQTRRRPSVLALTRDALAAPGVPRSRYLAEYAIASGLRRAYGVGATLSDVERLRQSCEHLTSTVAASQRRRALKSWSSTDFFALDLMALHGHIRLAPSPGSLEAQLAGYVKHAASFGVDGGKREFGDDVWPELFGEVPPFAALLKHAYAQPIGVPGLDQAMGGLLPAFGPSGKAPGLVNFLVGPSGSGKTALSLAVARTLAQFGSSVRFVSAGESLLSLASKEAGSSESAWWTAFGAETSGDLAILESKPQDALVEIVRRAERGFGGERGSGSRSPLSPAFPRVLVIDGAPFVAKKGRGNAADLSGTLQGLRDAGICTFLTCSAEDAVAHQLEPLADNVLRLGFEREPTGRHETRTLVVAKTRLQHGDRGRHVLRVGGRAGVTVSPSLHSVLRRLDRSEGLGKQGLVHLPFKGARKSLAPRLVDPSHSLVFGLGSSGKAGFALGCLLSPRAKLETDVLEKKDLTDWARRSRTLVVSFLYPESYYSDLAQRILQRGPHREASAGGTVETWALYPGFIDPETFVDELQRRIELAELQGRPFTGVLIDGIHNLLLEFPLLQADELLWPCVYRILRANRIATMSTFTFFDIPLGATPDGAKRSKAPSLPGTSGIAARSELFLHMLVSCCDYSFNLSRTAEGKVVAEIQATMDSRARRGASYVWDPEKLSLSPYEL